jgi:hypothetical protein
MSNAADSPTETPTPVCALDWFSATLPKWTVCDSRGSRVWPEQLPYSGDYPLEVRRTENGEVLGLLFSPPDNVFVPAERAGDEAGILWLRSPELYPVYVRESLGLCCGFELPDALRRGVEALASQHDRSHLVAIAILATDRWAHQPLEPISYRFWWVKGRDAFHGYRPCEGDNVRNARAPAEAVLTASVAPNTQSTRGYDRTFPRQSLRASSESK